MTKTSPFQVLLSDPGSAEPERQINHRFLHFLWTSVKNKGGQRTLIDVKNKDIQLMALYLLEDQSFERDSEVYF